MVGLIVGTLLLFSLAKICGPLLCTKECVFKSSSKVDRQSKQTAKADKVKRPVIVVGDAGERIERVAKA